jgi:hypothetical protein
MKRFHWYYNRIKSYVGRPRLQIQEKPVILDQVERCSSPVFIIGVHRSGTSLVRRMFNSHPDIACPPESFFMEHYARMLDDTLVANGYEGFGHDRDDLRADLARKASDLHEAYRITQGKKLWADKTPAYTAIIDQLDRLFARKARFVMVLRHPSDIVYSNFKRGWNFNGIDDPFEAAVQHVRDGIDNMLEFEARFPERCTRIIYRSLCDNPAATLMEAMDRIGLEYHPAMLAFADNNHNYGLEDPVIRGKKTVDLSSGAWRAFGEQQRARLCETFGPKALEENYWEAGA